ncbi:GntR family transcriptional regulator [Lentzea sp. NBRC 105346]|uniref:MocR-like pyridoxine biosynthesis transcription factor PdxR n=1 Tax=Lentzea sp. NBRC 105346 TaxID=3032205 RepID=UPI0024A31662|nr:PLP-dependent aminotransferase family protein [Lentzea sp. NBRC 105346]GLZ32976.1 GntR family transcriptional regulator [Lentzea sp. NBRC 105346]
MESWATFGSDFYLDLSGTGGLRSRLTRSLRDAIRSARLAPGTRLPSSRTLAVDLGVARNTVAAAYDELVAEGWLTARRGSGTRVAQRVTPPAPALRQATVAQSMLDLSVSTPDITLFPRTGWLRSARRALTVAPHDAFAPCDAQGRVELRVALAEYLARARGVRADPGRIVVVSGTAHALRLLNVLVPGPFAVESYGLGFHRDLLSATTPVPVDDHGVRVEYMPAVPAALLTPAHQFPLGGPLHPRRRADAVEWARATDAWVLEDDYDGEFRYDRDPVGALQGLDPERVVYLGTASKSLSPALRLGWMVVPDRLVDPVVALKGESEQYSSALDQLTLADFISSGEYDSHVRRMRSRYRQRRDQLVAASPVPVSGLAAGLHAVLELPAGREPAVVRAARAAGLGVSGLDHYRHPDAAPERHGLVVSFGAPAFPRALAPLCRVLAEHG